MSNFPSDYSTLRIRNSQGVRVGALKASQHHSARLLTREEVANHFGLSKRFLEISSTKNDGPPFVRIGRSVRHHAIDVHSWIKICVIDPAA
jgi:predicted DNA-binding transcriptional regulator AlpA